MIDRQINFIFPSSLCIVTSAGIKQTKTTYFASNKQKTYDTKNVYFT